LEKFQEFIDDEKAELEISENLNVKIIKSTISQIISKTENK